MILRAISQTSSHYDYVPECPAFLGRDDWHPYRPAKVGLPLPTLFNPVRASAVEKISSR